MNFKEELTNLINTHSKENDSNTPDFILAEYIEGCLKVFSKTTKQRELWYSHNKAYKEK